MVISIADMPEEEHFKRHFGSDQSVWRDGDWNGFVRIALAGLLAPFVELAQRTLCAKMLAMTIWV